MAKNIAPSSFPHFSGTDDKGKQKYVADIYEYADQKAQEAINWYLQKKGSKCSTAQGLRFAAIVLTTVGGLAPLIVATRILPAAPALDYTQFGYIALGLAGACVALDKFFGFSSAWMRYITASMTLQRLLSEFYVDWAILNNGLAEAAPAAAERDAMLRRIQTFLQRIMAEVEKETAEWAAEYRSNLADVEKSARQQLESSKPGVINLTVSNASQIKEGVIVLLDDQPRQTMFSPECEIGPVFPGDHFVRVKATVNGLTVTAGAPIRMGAGQSVPLTLNLPMPKV